jgi:hypothetical protein
MDSCDGGCHKAPHDFGRLRVRAVNGVAYVTIDHPPINQTLATAAAERRMRWFLASGGQTPDVERDLAALLDTYEE